MQYPNMPKAHSALFTKAMHNKYVNLIKFVSIVCQGVLQKIFLS